MAESCSNWKRWRMELEGVEHDADAQRQVAGEGEVDYADGRAVVVEEAEVILLEVGNEAAFFVGDGEDEVDLVGLDADGGDSLFGGLCNGRGLSGGGQHGSGGLSGSREQRAEPAPAVARRRGTGR